MEKDEIEAALEALNVRAYVSQGRMLERLTEEDLTQRWIASYVAWAAGNEDAGNAENDARAEMSLRNMEVPVEQLGAALREPTPEMEAVRAHLLELYLSEERKKLLGEPGDQMGRVEQ